MCPAHSGDLFWPALDSKTGSPLSLPAGRTFLKRNSCPLVWFLLIQDTFEIFSFGCLQTSQNNLQSFTQMKPNPEAQ